MSPLSWDVRWLLEINEHDGSMADDDDDDDVDPGAPILVLVVV